VLTDAAVLIEGERIAAVGPFKELRTSVDAGEVVEVDGVLFPGLVDSHTHAVFGKPRLADHERRALGEDYKTIAAKGGGILESVRDVRERTEDDLVERTRRRLGALLAHGTTTVEVKSGYGLTLDAEVKQLRAASRAARDVGVHVVPTFLGAHEVPPEFYGRADAYLDLVINDMLPNVAAQGLARYCDVFCEPGVFTVAQSRRLLEAARRHGMVPKLHADELDGSGGAELAAGVGAVSADHLGAVSDAGIAALARSETVAVLLPGTLLFLGRRAQAPGRRLIDAGAAVALATDFNPGSSPGVSLPFMMNLGVSQMGLRPAEAVIAATVNGAAAVGAVRERGQIAEGMVADLALFAADDWREVPYWYGVNLVTQVWTAGSACPGGRPPVSYLA
jgi:imidazolonepropionase